jgi:hypothetical protein
MTYLRSHPIVSQYKKKPEIAEKLKYDIKMLLLDFNLKKMARIENRNLHLWAIALRKTLDRVGAGGIFIYPADIVVINTGFIRNKLRRDVNPFAMYLLIALHEHYHAANPFKIKGKATKVQEKEADAFAIKMFDRISRGLELLEKQEAEQSV